MLSFSSTQLSEKLINIGKKLQETNYASADPILEELQVQKLEDAIQILENEKEKYSQRNFHPIAAQITILLALTYRIKGDLMNWLQYIIRCLHPSYKRYLSEIVQQTFENHISSCENFTLEVKNNPAPFEFGAGFANHSIMPNQSPSVILAMKSAITSKLKAKNIIVNVKHSIDGISSYEIFNELELKENIPTKKLCQLGQFSTGSITIDSISMKLGETTLVFNKFGTIGCDEAVIFPFDHECGFSAKLPEFGVVQSTYPIKVLAKDIPAGAISQQVKIEILNEKDSFKFINSSNPQIFMATKESPQDSTETVAEILVNQPCGLEISISATISFGIVTSKWHKTYSIQFYNTFTPHFAIVNPGYQFANKLPKEIVQNNQQSIIMAQFTSNCPNQIIVTNIATKTQNNIESVDNSSIFPMNLNSTDVLSYSAFFTPHPGAISGPLGQMEIYFHDTEYNEMKYIATLPEIIVVDKIVDISLDLPPEVEEKKFYTVNVFGRSMRGTFPTEFVLTESDDILFEGETSKRVRFTEQMETIATLKFMAVKTGTINFPTISILVVNDRGTTVIWQKTPSLFVRYQHD